MAMINFHTTVLHFHTTVLHFHTAVFHFYTAPSRLCLAQEVPHKRSAGGLGNLIRPFALQNTCLVVQTPVWLCKTPVWLCKHPLGSPENQKLAQCDIQQQYKRPFIKPNSTANKQNPMFGRFCAPNPAWCAWWWKSEAPLSFFQTAVFSTQTAAFEKNDLRGPFLWASLSRIETFTRNGRFLLPTGRFFVAQSQWLFFRRHMRSCLWRNSAVCIA